MNLLAPDVLHSDLGGTMNLRRISATIAAAAILSIGVIATPASAAPTKYTVPVACQASLGKTITATQLKSYGEVVKAGDVHPNKGTEYSYVLNCTDGKSDTPRPVIVVASSTGKALSATVLEGRSFGVVKSVSKSGGVKVRVFEDYKNFVDYDRTYTVKWTSAGKKVVSKQSTPGYVKATYNLAVQMKNGSKLTAVKASTTSLSKLKSFGKKYAAASTRHAYCDYISSTQGQCAILYIKGNTGHYALFNASKSGSTYKATSVRVVSAEVSGG